MPASTLFQLVTTSDVGQSTMGASATDGPGHRDYGFPARTGPSTVTGGDFTVASIAILPTTLAITAPATSQLTATVKTADGSVLADLPTSWNSSDTGKATVSATGLVTGVAAGTTNVTALFATGSITSNTCVVTVS